MTPHGRSISILRTAFVSAAALCACAPAFGSDWPCWRNSTRDGTSTEPITTDWVARPPRNLWIKYVGPGDTGTTCYSSVSVVGDRAYTMGLESGNDTVLCLNAATGANIWKFSYPTSAYGGARSTPNVSGGVVYTVSAGGNVFALNAVSGSQVWNKNLAVTPGIVAHRWGLSGSPVVSGNLVILNAGTEGIALDKANGNIVWQTGNLAAGFSTPVPFTDNGTSGMMMFTATGVTAMSLAGATMWRVPWPTNDNQNISDLIVSGDKFFVCSGYWVGGGVYQMNGGTPARLWFNMNLSNYWVTCVLKDGYLYGDQWQGGNGDNLNCVEFSTGALKWSKKWDRSFVQMIAGGKMLVISSNGVMTMVELTPTAYTALASANVIGSTVNGDTFDSPPTFANGKLYIHSKQGAINCIDLSPPPSSVVYGDANGDGGFALADINQMVDWLLARSAPPASGSARFTACDVNGDGVISLADLNLFVDRLLGRITKFPVEP